MTMYPGVLHTISQQERGGAGGVVGCEKEDRSWKT